MLKITVFSLFIQNWSNVLDILAIQLMMMAVGFLTLAYGLFKTSLVHSTVQDFRNAIRPQYVQQLPLGLLMAFSSFYVCSSSLYRLVTMYCSTTSTQCSALEL